MAAGSLSVLFRLDACARLGAGHLMRCRSLALALRSRGVRCAFALAPSSAAAARGLAGDGFETASVAATDLARLGAADLEATAAAARELGAAIVVVDHYGASADYLAGLVARGCRVGVVDDLADRDLGAAEWVLNQNLAAPSLAYPVARTALGVDFALLRPEFAAARAALRREFAAGDRRVLVTLGGGDTDELAAAAVAACEAVERPLELSVVVAGDAPALARAAAASRHAVEVRHDVREMAPLMAAADVSVNAGGSTCWELACLGLPMAVASLSRDQSPNARALAEAGAALAAPDPAGAALAAVALLADPERREAMSAAASALVDGRGAERAAASLLSALETPRAAA